MHLPAEPIFFIPGPEISIAHNLRAEVPSLAVASGRGARDPSAQNVHVDVHAYTISTVAQSHHSSRYKE